MNDHCLIISGGDYHPLPEELKNMAPAFVIACDRGWQHAERMGLKTDLALGDFDSAPLPEILPIQQAPARKDDTDTLLGVKEALERGYGTLHILCAFGGRLDHSLANLQAGGYAACRGATVWLYGGDTRALVCGPCRLEIPRRLGWSLSLFALGEPVEGLSLKGTLYEGEGMELTARFPLGISNGWRADTAEIAWEKGILTIIESQLQEGELLK